MEDWREYGEKPAELVLPDQRPLVRPAHLPSHFGRDLPILAPYVFQITCTVQMANGGINNGHPLGVVLAHNISNTVLVCDRVSWLLYDAETGADGSNYTDMSVRVGPTASSTEMCLLDTQTNPAVGDIISQDMHVPLDPGALLWAYWSRTGTGSVNYNGKLAVVIFDIIAERLP